MSGKHGRRRLGRSDEPAGVAASSAPEARATGDAAASSAGLPPPPSAGHAPPAEPPPSARLLVPAPPMPPSLPPIRSSPLPVFGPALPPPGAVAAPPPPPAVVVPPPPAVVVPPPPAVVVPPPPAVVVPPPPAVVVPESVEAVDEEPPLALPPRSRDGILPRKRLGSRGAAREEEAGRRRRFVLAGVAGCVVVALLVWWVVAASGGSGKKAAPVVAAGRTQTTMLIQLSGALGTAVNSALVAHDPARHAGVVVLVPAGVVAQVPGFGSMPFGQALSVGDPTASRTALSDLMGVTVDGAWKLTPQALASLVDKVGGVTVTVDHDVTKAGTGGSTVIAVPAGQQKLNGSAAVAFGSFLATGETEQARLARFDAVLRQVIVGLPKGDAAVVSVLSGLGAGSVSSFPNVKLAALLTGLSGDIAASAIDDEVLPVTPLDTGQDQRAFTLDAAKTATLVKDQLSDSVPTNRLATGNRVYVQNQVGTPGIGESTRAKLAAAGFVYVHGDNTEDMPNPTAPSVVVIFGRTAAQIAQGQAVAQALGLPSSDVKVSDVGFTVADVAVKLGVDYKQ